MAVKNIAGVSVNDLVVVSFIETKKGKAFWLCRCVCGNTTTASGNNILRGKVKSCGCRTVRLGAKKTHGMSRTPEYHVWKGMRGRCSNPSDRDWPLYGGRGVAVCDEWDKSFESFLADMGHRPSAKHSIDRIDTNGNYEPGNCRWATVEQQSRNRRNNRYVEFAGETVVIPELARRYGVDPRLARTRYLRYGWSLLDAVSTPVGIRSRWKTKKARTGVSPERAC